jgi:hypothetical protein
MTESSIFSIEDVTLAPFDTGTPTQFELHNKTHEYKLFQLLQMNPMWAMVANKRN